MTRRDPLVAIHHVHNCGREALEMVEGWSRSDLDSDRMLELALSQRVTSLGRALGDVSDSFAAQFADVKWREDADFGLGLIYEFDKIDYDELWNFVQDELPGLVAQMEEILAERGRLRD